MVSAQFTTQHRNAYDPTEAVMIRGRGRGYLIITGIVEWGAFLTQKLKLELMEAENTHRGREGEGIKIGINGGRKHTPGKGRELKLELMQVENTHP